jgi:hypothetical protein
MARGGQIFGGGGQISCDTGTKNFSDRSEIIPLTRPNRLSSDQDEFERDECEHKYISDRPCMAVLLALEQNELSNELSCTLRYIVLAG